MARTVITKVSIPLNGSAVIPTASAVTAGEGAEIAFDGYDTKTLIILENTAEAAATAKILKGNGLQGVADLSVTLAAGEKRGVVIESGPFKNVSGADKGKVIIEDADDEAVTLKVACVLLP